MQTAPFIFGNKPFGVTTHQCDPLLPGYQDWLSQNLQKKIYPSHRLDKETTGALVFPSTKEAAALLTEEFAQSRVEKEYLFITDQTPPQKNWINNSKITAQKSEKPLISETAFEVLTEDSGFFIIKAQPKTGRTHQIRIHAADSKVPLLGDTQYGGSVYPHFFLHCQKIAIPALDILHTSTPPLFFKNLNLLHKPLLIQWLMSVDRRERLYSDTSASAYRWIHEENTPLRLDVLGNKGCAGWWRDTPPNTKEMDCLVELFDLLSIKEWRLMHHSGQRTQDKPLVDAIIDDSWMGCEKNLNLEFKKEAGLSCGLFLDQRENRSLVQSQSAQKNILNLFAYSGAFSVAAAIGGATKVTTVDLSKNYIEWCKKNFSHNSINTEAHGFYAMDTMDYLKYAHKKQLLFDWIICDPPSFSRDKKGKVFRIEKDFQELIGAACKVLSPSGTLLFSTNYEKWTADRWGQELIAALKGEHLEITQNLSFQWDFETHHNRHMKAFLIKKK